MRNKTQKRYKQLLMTHYQFTEIDFHEECDTIYTICKDNVMERVRDVYEELYNNYHEK